MSNAEACKRYREAQKLKQSPIIKIDVHTLTIENYFYYGLVVGAAGVIAVLFLYARFFA